MDVKARLWGKQTMGKVCSWYKCFPKTENKFRFNI